MAYDKGCLFLICVIHLYLIVSGESIYKAKQLVSHSGIYQLVNVRQRVAIFRVTLIQIREVYTHSPFTVCLLTITTLAS